MEINLLSGALGAEIKGISLKDTSKENWEKINSLMLEHKVVFFRESSDTENFSISDSNKIKWGSLSIELEGVSLSSENDVFVEFIEIA